MRERVWVDKEHRLRWRRSKLAWLQLMYNSFLWAKMVRDGLAVAVAADGIYKVRWQPGSIDETLTISRIERL